MLHQLRSGDVYENWCKIMQWTRLDGHDLEARKKHFATVNMIFSVAWFLTSMRHASALITPTDGPHHLLGQTFISAGSSAKIVSICAASGFLQFALTRLTNVFLIRSNHTLILKTVKKMVSVGDQDKRLTNIRLCRLMLMVGLNIWSSIVLNGSLLYTSVFYLSVQASKTRLEITCWTVWWLVDQVTNFYDGIDMSFAPVTWLLIALNYRSNVASFIQRLEDMIAAQTDEGWTVVYRLKDVHTHYAQLVGEAEDFNRSSPILMSIMLCTTPLACCAAFVAQFPFHPLISSFVFMACLPPVVAVLYLLRVAADITSMAGEITTHLNSIACRERNGKHLNARQRQLLLQMIQEIGSEKPLIVVQMTDGKKWTPELLLYYVIESTMMYTLLITFNSFLGAK